MTHPPPTGKVPISIQPVTPARLGDFLRLFDGAPHHTEKAEQIASGAATGLLAYHAGHPVGGCHAGPRHIYSLLPADLEIPIANAEDRAAVVCVMVPPNWRGHGITRQLLDATCKHLAAQGYTSIEAYPRKSPESAAPDYEESLALYLDAGFHLHREFDDAYMLRKALTEQGD